MGRKVQFDATIKAKFLELYYETPNIAKCAKKLGFSRRTVTHHLAQDEAFRGDFMDIEMAHADEAKEQLVQASRGILKLGQNFMPTIAVVKAHFSKYQDKVKHDHLHTDSKKADVYLDKLKKVEVLEFKPDAQKDNS